MIKLIIGLGNPGTEYKNAYHNAGWLFVDFLADRTNKTNGTDRTYKICKTDCFMNQSGGFILKILRKNGLKPAEIMIAHDDSDLALGKYKISFGRGSAGHKGVESVIKALKTKNFWRLRIGIRPGWTDKTYNSNRTDRMKAGAFVLKNISLQNRKKLEETFQTIAESMGPAKTKAEAG